MGTCRWLPDEYVPVTAAAEAYSRGDLTSKQMYAEISSWIDLRFVVNAMDNLFIKLSPMEYTGDDYGNDIGQQFSAFVADTRQAIADASDDEDTRDEMEAVGISP